MERALARWPLLASRRRAAARRLRARRVAGFSPRTPDPRPPVTEPRSADPLHGRHRGQRVLRFSVAAPPLLLTNHEGKGCTHATP
jgi:hypothetical protein